MRISDAINNAPNLTILCQILENEKSQVNPRPAKCSLSFWCQQRVSVKGYQGTIHILALIEKVLNLVKNNPRGPFEFLEEERVHGETIAALIDKFDDETGDRYKKACGVTKFFWCIVWAIPAIYIFWRYNLVETQWYNNLEERMFDYYTKNQYVEKFKEQPPARISRTNPNRWLAPN